MTRNVAAGAFRVGVATGSALAALYWLYWSTARRKTRATTHAAELGSEAAAALVGDPPAVTVLDGGLGLELKMRKARGERCLYDLTLFSTAALLHTPEAIRRVHEDYVAAGAQVLTTATFAVTRQYLDKVGQRHRIPELAQRAVRLARQAADGGGPQVKVAGSVPPLGECYRADLVKGHQEMREEYAQLTMAMAGPGVDIWLCETMSSMEEAQAAVLACQAASACYHMATPVWLSFVLRRSESLPYVELMDGTPLLTVAATVKRWGVDTLLFNCCTVELISTALQALEQSRLEGAEFGGLRFGAYGNFFEEHKADWTIESQESEPGKGDQATSGLQTRDISTGDYVECAQEWVRAGAQIVGGCCGIGPSHIHAISAALSQSTK